jgi:hypothetical protein
MKVCLCSGPGQVWLGMCWNARRYLPSVSLIWLLPLFLPSFFLNIYFFMSFQQTQHALSVSNEKLESAWGIQSQLHRQIKGLSALEQDHANLQRDCSEVSHAFEDVWTRLSQVLALPQGKQQADIDVLLGALDRVGLANTGTAQLDVKAKLQQVAAAQAYKHYPTPKVSVLWYTECGCTGIQVEAINIVYPMWRKGMNIAFNNCDNPCDFKLPEHQQRMLDEMTALDTKKQQLWKNWTKWRKQRKQKAAGVGNERENRLLVEVERLLR